MIQPYRINNCKFQQSMISFLRELHESKAYTDVVLHAEGKLLNAHRVVLAAGSGYFNSLFSTLPTTPSQSLVVALPNVKYKDLEQVVKFIYHGYVDIVDSELEKFVSLAKELRVVGMIDDEEEEVKSAPSHVPTAVTAPSTSSSVERTVKEFPTQAENNHDDEEEEEQLDDDDEQLGLNYEGDPNELDFEDDFEVDFTEGSMATGPPGSSGALNSTQSDSSKPFVCLKCGKTYNSNKSLWRHKKFNCDEKITFTCEICGKVFSRSDNLRRHVVVAHNCT